MLLFMGCFSKSPKRSWLSWVTVTVRHRSNYRPGEESNGKASCGQRAPPCQDSTGHGSTLRTPETLSTEESMTVSGGAWEKHRGLLSLWEPPLPAGTWLTATTGYAVRAGTPPRTSQSLTFPSLLWPPLWVMTTTSIHLRRCCC